MTDQSVHKFTKYPKKIPLTNERNPPMVIP